MVRAAARIVAVAWLALAAPAAALDGGRYGETKLVEPAGVPRGLVFLFSDAGGWKASDDARLKAAAAAGAIAVGVDTDAYLARVEADGAGCLKLYDDADQLSRQLQRAAAGEDYFAPIMAGVGEGGALAAAIVEQARDGMLAGAVSLAPGPLSTPRPFCAREAEPADAYAPPIPGAPAPRQFWTVVVAPGSADRARYVALAARASNVKVRADDAPDAPATLAALIAPRLARDASDRVSELPLVEFRSDRPSRKMAIFVSGDGGWREVDGVIARKLRDLGLSVVGWDSLRYFWRKKTPDGFAADLSAVIAAYRAKWGADDVALIGFSFGADVLPFAYDRLPEQTKARVRLLSLLSLGKAADWEIQVSGWLGFAPSHEATPTSPAVRPIPARLIQCVYGSEDAEALCPDLRAGGVEVIEKSGSHHFDHDYDRIAEEILAGFDRRIADGR